jgi:hypothetical protein
MKMSPTAIRSPGSTFRRPEVARLRSWPPEYALVRTISPPGLRANL